MIETELPLIIRLKTDGCHQDWQTEMEEEYEEPQETELELINEK